MRLSNHIANRFLNDESLTWEIMEIYHPDIYSYQNNKDLPDQVSGTYHVVSNKGNKSYYVTESVLSKLPLLKPSYSGNILDWTVFKDIPEGKRTFVLPNNSLLRIVVTEDKIMFLHLQFSFTEKEKGIGYMNTCMFFLNRKNNEVCSHYFSKDVQDHAEKFYKLLCFVFLSDVEEIIILPGRKYGTKITGKLVNELGQKLAVINSRWNVKTIMTQGFGVSGHFRLQPVGEGRSQRKVIWIDPFEKSGYTRNAGKETVSI